MIYLIGIYMMALGLAVMPHPLLYGGNAMISNVLLYSGMVVILIGYFRNKNWL